MTGGTALTIGPSSTESWMLAAGQAGASGMPRRSTTKWYLEPGLPRSVGFGPVSVPPLGAPRSARPRSPATSQYDRRGRAGPIAWRSRCQTRRAASRAAAASR